MTNDSTSRVAEHYESVAETYQQRYDRAFLLDTTRKHPANYFRLQLLLNSFVSKGIKRVIEVGVGEGTPLATLANAGIEVWGFDIAENMVGKAKESMQRAGQDPERVSWGDIEDPLTYSRVLRNGPFDGVMAMGVMPHVHNDEAVIGNMAVLLRPGGTAFVEFRNKLFSLFSFNRYTCEFILNDLLANVDEGLKAKVARELEGRLRMDLPPARAAVPGTNAPGYDGILSKFHNPFEVPRLFERCGFRDIRLLWYHYHPAMPMIEEQAPEVFRQEAIRLEHERSGWKGFFLCSAFVVEAVKQ